MLTNPTWVDLCLRLALATLAGILVGYNREARSQAAGLRTTTLVCVSACLSMVLANLMLQVTGPDPKSFVRLDVMRLPLGVLTGIGFIGAGAIVRRGDSVVGVSTAATLWFMTLVGLAIGAGQFVLGGAVTLGGLALLWALERADFAISRRFRAALTVFADTDQLDPEQLRDILDRAGQRIVAWGVTYREAGRSYVVRAELEWDGRAQDRASPPAFVEQLVGEAGVGEVDWTPQAVSG
jgi:putative Mg2+ transporter-C (MgtC) family protein